MRHFGIKKKKKKQNKKTNPKQQQQKKPWQNPQESRFLAFVTNTSESNKFPPALRALVLQYSE